MWSQMSEDWGAVHPRLQLFLMQNLRHMRLSHRHCMFYPRVTPKLGRSSVILNIKPIACFGSSAADG